MNNYNITANQIRLAKLEMDIAEAQAKIAKDKYEALRKQLANDMVTGEVFKFEISGGEGYPGMSFRLETKERWSPVVENKDKLMEVLKQDAPELFSITAPSLSKYIAERCEYNNGELPSEFEGLVKKYDDTHVVVRTTNK